ncbi:hypothetical protein [Rubrivivax gelatinosus]|nr:hypothetical protein [Rubrivivax gelatinosus]
MKQPIRLPPEWLEWRRRERRLDLIAALLLCGAVSLVCWVLPQVA